MSSMIPIGSSSFSFLLSRTFLSSFETRPAAARVDEVPAERGPVAGRRPVVTVS